MIKRYSIIALLIFSYTFVLGHSIIPHHHHDDDHEMEQFSHHQDDHENDDHNDDDSGLAHDFGNYLHSGEAGDLHQQSGNVISCKTIATAYIISLFDFKISAFESPPPILRHSNDLVPLSSHCLFSKGLRAPPCFIA
jgi:hypothetical protein